MGDLEVVLKEIEKHNITGFQVIKSDAQEVRLSLEYLKSTGEKEKAAHLVKMAYDSLLRIGPVETFLASAISVNGKEYIIISDQFPQYNNTHERAISLIYEINNTQAFKAAEMIDEETLENNFQAWVKEFELKKKELEEKQKQEEQAQKAEEQKESQPPEVPVEDVPLQEGPAGSKKEEPTDVMPQYQDLIKEDSPTVKLVNLILTDAVKNRAGDVYIEPTDQAVKVTYRVDGDLINITNVPMQFYDKMMARIKTLSNLDVAQTASPQNGRIHLKIEDRKVDLRVSTVPSFHGEKIVIRIISQEASKYRLVDLGFMQEDQKLFMEAVSSSQGMVFVTGPAGSGTTSTLYAVLNHIKSESANIITIEDPIEFVVEGIKQMEVDPAVDPTFTDGLRKILHQDPDIIFIGEIRDQETAEIALKASLTGHLVLSTIHTNSCVETIARLAEMGLDYSQIASSVNLIVGQRLVKVICKHCKKGYEPEEDFKKKFAYAIKKHKIEAFYKGQGCEKCNQTGFLGRTAVYEILKITKDLKDVISRQASEEEILGAAQKNGFKLMAERGIEKVKEGITTLDEIEKNAELSEKKLNSA